MSSSNLSLNISATLSTGTKGHVPPGLNFASTPGQFTLVNLPSGNTTVNPPAGTNTIVVIMPATTATVTIKGIAGDTGIPIVLSATAITWFVLPIGTSFVATASVAVTGIELLYL